MSAKGHMGPNLEVGVHPHATGLQLVSDLGRLGDIAAPHGGTEARVEPVGAADHVSLVGPPHDGQDWSKGLLGLDARALGRVVDDGRGQDEALALLLFLETAGGDLPTLLFGRLEQVEDLGVLHAVLDGADARVGVRCWPGLQVIADEVHHGLQEVVVDLLVDICDVSAFYKACHNSSPALQKRFGP